MSLDAIIFDMDGLMFDTETVWTSVWPIVCDEFGVPFASEIDDACRGTSGNTFIDVVNTYYKARGFENFDGKVFMERLWAAADHEFDKGIKKMFGLDEILAWVREQNLPAAVASGSNSEQITHHLRLTGLSDFFDVTVSGFDVEHSKPEPDIFLEAARLLSAEPSRTVVLEDSCNGIRAAAAGGFIPIMVPGFESPEDVAGLYRYVCADLVEARDLLNTLSV